MEEPTLLVTVQRVVGRIYLQHDAHRGPLMRCHKLLDVQCHKRPTQLATMWASKIARTYWDIVRGGSRHTTQRLSYHDWLRLQIVCAREDQDGPGLVVVRRSAAV